MRQLRDVLFTGHDFPLAVGDSGAVVVDPDLHPITLIRGILSPDCNCRDWGLSVLYRVFDQFFHRMRDVLTSVRPQLLGEIQIDVGLWVGRSLFSGRLLQARDDVYRVGVVLAST